MSLAQAERAAKALKDVKRDQERQRRWRKGQNAKARRATATPVVIDVLRAG